ncbi:MAG: Gfo/Idh/MocA family oxidoreductase, partial [Acidimicrobiaceae bacterium]|nr:Gfo/Idh/MocA family oxidoreductase [Acidimicrobiaceae bacterium]
MKIILAGEGAIGRKHIAALQRIDDVEVVAIVGGLADDTEAFADEFGIERWTTDLAEALALDADAAILATPTQMHAAQAIQTMRAGKHVLVEIPMADNL